MRDVQDGLGIKNISDLVRKEIQGIFEDKHPKKEQIKHYKKSEAEIDKKNRYASCLTKYCRSDRIEKILKIVEE